MLTMKPVVSFARCPFLLFAFFSLISTAMSLDGATVESAPLESSVVTITECHSWGFDPSSLSCDTCSLLKNSPLAQFEQECLKCCQRFRPDPVVNPDAITGSFVGRYSLAVLRFEPDSIDSYEEVNNFLKEDQAEVLKEKGNKAFAVEKLDSNNDNAQMHGLMGLFGGSMRHTPPTIHFYKNHNGGKVGKADEEVSLRGFKREDIKDMLLTVLPS